MDDKKLQTKQSYDKNATMFAGKFDELGARKADIDKALSFIDNQNPFVFELGCGNGRDAKEILSRTNKYLGIDISSELIRLAKEKEPEGKFEEGDFDTYQFPKEVDVIFAFASLLHANKESLQDILNRACESLNTGGVFFLSLKYGEYVEKRQEDEFGVRYFYYYTPELVKELAGNKFNCVWEQVHDLRGQKWTEVILQKV